MRSEEARNERVNAIFARLADAVTDELPDDVIDSLVALMLAVFDQKADGDPFENLRITMQSVLDERAAQLAQLN